MEQISSLVVWACISMNGWHKKDQKDVCLFNGNGAACRVGSGIGFIGFLASIAFLAIEKVFQNLSSIKVRRRIVLADVGFSGNIFLSEGHKLWILSFTISLAAWAVLYLFAFGYLAISWGKADYPPLGKGINNCRAAIVFSFFSIGAWVCLLMVNVAVD